MGVILLVRHGQASFGSDNYDVLSPLGQRQARRLGQALKGRGVQPSLIVSGSLFLLGGIAGLAAARAFKKGSPPTPQMAIEEAQLIKQTLTAPHPATPTVVPSGPPERQ